MTSVTEPGVSWLKHREEFLDGLSGKEVSLAPPIFPVEECCRLLKEKFGKNSCSLSFELRGKMDPKQALAEFGVHCLVQPMVLQPVTPGNFFLVSSEEDLKEWIISVFSDSTLASYFYEKDKLLGFHYYFVAEMSHLLQTLQWIPSMSIKVAGDAEFSSSAVKENCQVVDISCVLDGKVFRFRLLFPEETLGGCETFFAGLNTAFDPEKIDKTLPLTMAVEIGHSSLTKEEWQAIVPGSFVMLDGCMFDPETGECGALVSIQKRKFFSGRFLDATSTEFKITGYSAITPEEEDNHMEDQPENAPAQENVGEGKDALSKLPINLVVEVARYSLTVEDFMKLTPGSTLNLGVSPNQGVDLVVQGAKVGRGEIIALGDVLGVRILDI
ncbi:type III secretion system cytoplasmic ring protein SctQ [Chlamydiifrater phoenicopteri]|uniref:type III secretion system cytoplasmic ring protein SctQ n=1 Tax=Chlamydiifrater phoenicopteri TaxID=2681469 RepID=UPI001BD12938|nr:type III secretion system cytoplasmic ring protein SctQ [Chlamydiifrater phoenicopteri]